LVAFAPSFLFIIAGASHFDRLRADARIRAFLTGAGAAVIGAIAGSAVPLGRELAHVWQLGILGLAAIWLLGLRRGVVSALVACGALGVIAVMAGAPA
jgi:chromate transporter